MSHDALAPQPELLNPEPSAGKRVAKWNQNLDLDRLGEFVPTGPKDIPGVDAGQLQAKYGPHTAYWPREHLATFRAPIGATQGQYERIRHDSVRAWLEHMDREGWQFHPEHRIKIYPGVYPAFDLRDRIPLFDQREFQVIAWFHKRNPETIRHELDPLVTEPFRVRD